MVESDRMWAEYERVLRKRLRAAATEMGVGGLSVRDVRSFYDGCRPNGHWVKRGFMRALALRLEAAGLLYDPAGVELFSVRLTEAKLTARGLGLLWLVEVVFHDLHPLIAKVMEQKRAEARRAEVTSG